jgi:hypothetical protein
VIWQKRAVLMGQDQNGSSALMYVQDGKVTVFPLGSREELAAGIKDISADYHHANSEMPMIRVQLYDNANFYFSPFFTNTGAPVMEKVTQDRNRADIWLSFCREYYGNATTILRLAQSDASATFYTIPFSQVKENSRVKFIFVLESTGELDGARVHKEAMTLLGTETLYHSRVFHPDDSTDVILGYTAANPEQSSVIGYIYNKKNDSLEQIAAFENIDLTKIASVVSCSADRLVLKMNEGPHPEFAGGTYRDALMISRDGGDPHYASLSLAVGSPDSTSDDSPAADNAGSPAQESGLFAHIPAWGVIVIVIGAIILAGILCVVGLALVSKRNASKNFLDQSDDPS